jgi:hypothetical protein
MLFVNGNDITAYLVKLLDFLNSQVNKKSGKRKGGRIDINPDFQSPDIEQSDSCFVWMEATLATGSVGLIFWWITSEARQNKTHPR